MATLRPITVEQFERGTNGNGPMFVAEPRMEAFGTWDGGRIVLFDESDRHYGPFLPDDVVAGPSGKVWRVMADGRGWDVTDVWEWQADQALLDEVMSSNFADSLYGQV